MDYRVQAYNTATKSKNRMHDDEVARQFGFRGGLVPGVDVYAYLCHPPVERWGRAWLERGTATARFITPVYDGDEVLVTAEPDGDNSLALVVTDPSGGRCAQGRAALPVEHPEAPTVADWPTSDPPATPPPVTAELLTTQPLGALAVTFHADRAGEYLDDIREHLPLFRDEGVAHPGWLLRYANYVLTANVKLGPWIHVESTVQFHRPVVDGETVETRALVTGEWERKGHRFVSLDVLQSVEGRPVTRTAHTAIYQPRSQDQGVTAAG
jgi:acyl dehydratase